MSDEEPQLPDPDEMDEEEFERGLRELLQPVPGTDEDAPVASEKRKSYCPHRRVVLNQEAHRVICRDCRREVDAFAYLVRLANEWERWAAHRREAEKRARAAGARLAEILRMERNARARLRRIDPDARPPKKPWGEGEL